MAYAQGSYPMIRELDKMGVKFEKDGSGEFDVRKVHHMGSYVLPMPEGHNVKKILYRQLKRNQVAITTATWRPGCSKALTAVSPARSASIRAPSEFLIIRAKAVILACGAAGRLGLPASGYLFGTYENATNCGDAMPWLFTPAPNSQILNAFRSTR